MSNHFDISVESDKPTGLRTIDVEFDQTDVSWYAPVEQRNITSFILAIKDHVTGRITRKKGPANTRQTVSGLKADRKYTVTVTSMLGEQVGKTSDELEFKTKPFSEWYKAEKLPTRPIAILAHFPSPSDITVGHSGEA